jgi:hypothetical protein
VTRPTAPRGMLTLTLLLLPHLAGAQQSAHAVSLDAAMQRERRALRLLVGVERANITSATEAIPAGKDGFAPSEGEFRGVRTFGQQVKHLAATNDILAAAGLGREPSADAGGTNAPTRTVLIVEALIHAYDPYGQMGVYRRMNGVVPPASRK